MVGVRPASNFGLDCIACLMAVISGSFAPSVHAAYTSNTAWTLWPCCFATHNGFLPTIKFQVTDECRAL